ncbi:hypothetical protein PHMEG_00010749 [Phytophthora megakarya]|uniref:Uncharacterized protein n=1 Tax=Phytophthora megakarya TaxID=4795 RepID=A0A225WDG6_9STRA|nr:hypothetical protein PHMEG_00010749 [Phytophthora megakarya]
MFISTKSLRASVEALDAELQHNKRVYSGGRQAILHSERTCEQLQGQRNGENYEKDKKKYVHPHNCSTIPRFYDSSLKERFKVYKTTAKERITKLEVEVEVANVNKDNSSQFDQLTNDHDLDITYKTTAKERITKLEVEVKVANVNKDNSSQIDQLTKSLSLSEKETTTSTLRIVESEKHVVMLQSEKEDLKLPNSSSKDTLHRFIRSLQNLLALVKLDDFPLNEAMRKLLLMVQDTLEEELSIANILDEGDKLIEIEVKIPQSITAEEN